MDPTPELSRLYAEYRGTLSLQRLRAEDRDEARLAYHLPFLERLDAVDGSSVVLYDMYRQKYAFLTGSFRFLLGYERMEAISQGPDYFFRQMHPEDLPVVLDTVIRTMRFLYAQPAAQRSRYKLSFDFRMRGSDGVYLRLLQQLVVLEQDARGNIWLVLAVNDRLPGGAPNAPVSRSVRGLQDGKYYLFVPEENPNTRSAGKLTPREIEILGLVAVGMASRQIADTLFISVATVNNHRQRILEKTRTRNSAEAVRYAAEAGLL